MTITFIARVRDGRLVLDEPVDLPEGTELELVSAHDVDDLDDKDRARLHASIARSAEQFRTGQSVGADVILGDVEAGFSDPQ